MTDTDKVVRDATTAKALAYIEYKHANIAMARTPEKRCIKLDTFEIRGLKSSAANEGCPLFIVVYYHYGHDGTLLHDHQYFEIDQTAESLPSHSIVKHIDHRQYYVIAANEASLDLIGEPSRMMSEHDYQKLLAHLAGVPFTGRDWTGRSYLTTTELLPIPEVIGEN